MLSDKNKYLVLIDKILYIFSATFGKDFLLIEKQVAVEHMGFFKIKYRYLPLEYDIVFESDRDIFSIQIYDNEGACNMLYRLEKYDNKTTPENVKKAAQILKNVLKNNDFCFYLSRGDKFYRKEGQQYKRIKDITEIMGGKNGGTKKL